MSNDSQKKRENLSYQQSFQPQNTQFGDGEKNTNGVNSAYSEGNGGYYGYQNNNAQYTNRTGTYGNQYNNQYNYPYNYPYNNAYQHNMLYYPTGTAKKAAKIYRRFTKKDFIFALLFLICSFLFADFAVFNGMCLGFTISFAALFVAASIYIGKYFKPFYAVCGALSIAGAVSFSLFSDFTVNFVMFFMTMFLFGIYCIGISGGFRHSCSSYKMLFDTVYECICFPFINLPGTVGSVNATMKKNKKLAGVFIGICVAIPAMIVIIPVLMRSDAAFEGLMDSFFGSVLSYVFEVVTAIICFILLFSFMFGRNGSEKSIKNVKISKIKKIPPSAGTSFLCVISVVYAAYIFSQTAYFFSAFKGILPDGYEYTASVYARRGFYEMFFVCVFNIIAVGIVMAITSKKTKTLKCVSIFVLLFSVLLTAISMRKMVLNVSIYALTKNRLIVSVIMIMLLVATVFFIIHILALKFKYMQSVIIICSIVFAAFSLCDTDARIAEYNINAYNSNSAETLDVDNLAQLSDSAVPYIAALTDNEDKEIAAKASLHLAIWLINNETNSSARIYAGVSDNKVVIKGNTDFRHFNYSRYNAANAVVSQQKEHDYTQTIELYDVLKNCYSWYYCGEDNYFSVYTDSGDYFYNYNEKTGKYEKEESDVIDDFGDYYDYSDDSDGNYDEYGYNDSYGEDSEDSFDPGYFDDFELDS